MKRVYLILCVLMPALSQAISIDSMSFAPGSGDLSMTYLGLVFGSVPGSGLGGGTNQLIGQIFSVFNTGVLVMTMGVVGYTVFTSTVGISQEGSGAFQTKISPWVTLRITAGSSLLIPSFSGYSAIQVLVMTIVVKGIGFANLIWDEVVDYVSGNHAVISGATWQGSGANDLSARNANTISNLKAIDLSGLEKMGACVWAYNQLSPGQQGPVATSDADANTITISAYDASGDPQSCGTIEVGTSSILGAVQLSATTIIGSVISQLNANSDATACTENSNGTTCANTESFYYHAWDILRAKAADIDNSSEETTTWQSEAKNRGWITAAAYYSHLTGAYEKNTSATVSLPSYESQSTDLDGQITITPTDGPINYQAKINAFYLSGTDQKSIYDSFIDQKLPAPTEATNVSGPATQIATAILGGYGQTFGSSWSKGPIGLKMLGMAGGIDGVSLFGGQPYFAFDHMVVLTNTVVTKLTGCSVAKCQDGGDFNKAGCTLLKKQAEACNETYSQDNGFLGMLYKQQNGYAFDPLNEMRSLGVVMISAAVNYWKTTLDVMYQKTTTLAWSTYGARIAINLPLSMITAGAYGWAPGFSMVSQGVQTVLNSMLDIVVGLIREALTVYLPFGTALATTFFGMGVVLGIYLPFMPYLLYIFGAIGWLIGVAESLVAAPLVAMGITHPEGHDLLGKAEQSLMLLLGIFVRPATMLIGFIFAINLASVAVSLLNIGFMNVFIDFISDSSSDPLVGSINLVGTMLVYTYVMMSVLDQAYSLIYQIPDRILRWIGGPADSPGAGAAQAAREVKQQTQSAGSQAGQGAGSAMRAPNLPSADSNTGAISDPQKKGQDAKSASDRRNDPSTGQ